MDSEKLTVVRQCLKRSIVFGGERHSGWLPPGAAEPLDVESSQVTADFRILRERPRGGFLLEYEVVDGAVPANVPPSGDTWHESLEEALAQAMAAFGIGPSEWQSARHSRDEQP